MENCKTETVWEKILEYASSPLQGTLSRRQRKGVKIQINESKIYENAVIFMSEDFIRFTLKSGQETINTYFDWKQIHSITTFSPPDDDKQS